MHAAMVKSSPLNPSSEESDDERRVRPIPTRRTPRTAFGFGAADRLLPQEGPRHQPQGDTCAGCSAERPRPGYVSRRPPSLSCDLADAGMPAVLLMPTASPTEESARHRPAEASGS
eukprot:751766-Pleurochrysis_carterae.AAC.1